jgi:hypothetical protein
MPSSLQTKKLGKVEVVVVRIKVGWWLWFRSVKTALEVQSWFTSLPPIAFMRVAFDLSAVRAVYPEALARFKELAEAYREDGSEIVGFGLQRIEDPHTAARLEEIFGKYENETQALDALHRPQPAKELQNQFAAVAAAGK